jgi:hypothetical protein
MAGDLMNLLSIQPPRQRPSHFDGILGHNYLREFTVTIDYQAEVLYLQKPQIFTS